MIETKTQDYTGWTASDHENRAQSTFEHLRCSMCITPNQECELMFHLMMAVLKEIRENQE